ncbi:MAG: PepSY domain-containing protein [Cypionkella sp.]|uniref:PepSY domain-containing protein n=1 Tax=Cypionkella sp. TaxID=2811411 RepID=UPI002AB9D751|nr:PepSY domain-containing protein [Cypionkella sp.]MDZ4312344.1 PepSY domain-containing protein [Cypionkella sp.]
MKLTAKPLMITALFGLWASTAQAAITVQDVVRTYQDAAYTHIEVKEGPTQIKVEAVKDGVKLEVVYDKASGAEVKRETETVGTTVGGSGVEISTDDDDFTDDNDDHDGMDDDSSDDDGSDDSDSDHSGSDDGDDHDSGDDHGGSDHDDSDHDDSGHDGSGHDSDRGDSSDD